MERRFVNHAGAALLGLLLAAASLGPAAADDAIRIPLGAMNGSGESGVAILTPKGAKTLVQLQLHGGSGDPQPTHFHTGTCDSPEMGSEEKDRPRGRPLSLWTLLLEHFPSRFEFVREVARENPPPTSRQDHRQ